jgi:hypothetical protein
LRKDFTQSAMHLSNSNPSLPTIQISLSQKSRAESLRQRECLDLSEALEAIELFLTDGPMKSIRLTIFVDMTPMAVVNISVARVFDYRELVLPFSLKIHNVGAI